MLYPFRSGLGRWLAGFFFLLLPLAWVQAAEPRDEVPPPPASAPKPSSQDEDLRARIERLEKQNLELLQALKQLQNQLPKTGPAPPSAPATSTEPGNLDPNAVKAIVSDYIKERDDNKKAEEEAKKQAETERGFVVGESLGMTAKWNHGLWFESREKAFRIHVGGRTQFDIVTVGTSQDVMFGKGGIGPFDDAVNFRRARLAVEGSLWENLFFNCEYDFANVVDVEPLTKHTPTASTVINTPVPNHMEMQISHLPLIGNFRAGNMKPPIGFEHLVSSRFLNFLERSYQYDAFIENGNNGFYPGLMVFNSVLDDNVTWWAGLFKNNRSIFGWNVGDGEWGGSARLTWVPVFQEEGRYLLHLGLGTWYSDLDDNIVRWRARPLIRNGNAVLHNTVAIAQLHGDNETRLNPELVIQYGPFLLQAEYMACWVGGVDRIIAAGSAFAPVQKDLSLSTRNYFGQGVSVETLWFLTGDHRGYNKKTGVFGRVIPFRNFYLVRGEDGLVYSPGAWQVGLRYSYLDLNDKGIYGGELQDVTVGLNWFLNPNFKIQWNYSLGFRSVPTGTSDGPFHAGGMRFALDF